jgi:hypothetical protein
MDHSLLLKLISQHTKLSALSLYLFYIEIATIKNLTGCEVLLALSELRIYSYNPRYKPLD